MRILLVYSYLPTHLGGIETVMDALATEYARRGHEVVAAGADIPHLATRAVSTAYRQLGVPAWNGLEERLGVPVPLHHPAMLGTLRREIARVDLIHGHGFLAAPTLAAFLLARSRGRDRPICLLTEHVGHVVYPSAALDLVERIAIQSHGRAAGTMADGIVALNDRVQRELRTLLPETPVRWIPNGVDTERYSPASPERRARLRAELGWDQTPRVLFVGRLVAKKGAEIAVQSAEASGGRWKVVLAGPGTLPGAMSAHAELVGPLPPERVADLYRAADAFLLPSHGEGFPVTAQEALASGLPVFLGEDASYAPYLKHPGPGLRLIPRAPDVIAARLTAFLADAEERQRAQADALAQARRLFSWGTTVDAHLEFIEELRTRLVPSR